MWEASRNNNSEIKDYKNHWAVKYTTKIFPVYEKIENHNFFTKISGKLYVTPLFLCLVVIEVADIMFAFDSVPAIIAITEKPFLIYTSNIFAILGLRSMYFMLSAAKRFLCHLEKAVILILVVIGIKMFITALELFHIESIISLSVVLGLLALGVLASFIWKEESEENGKEETIQESKEEEVSKEE